MILSLLENAILSPLFLGFPVSKLIISYNWSIDGGVIYGKNDVFFDRWMEENVRKKKSLTCNRYPKDGSWWCRRLIAGGAHKKVSQIATESNYSSMEWP